MLIIWFGFACKNLALNTSIYPSPSDKIVRLFSEFCATRPTCYAPFVSTNQYPSLYSAMPNIYVGG